MNTEAVNHKYDLKFYDALKLAVEKEFDIENELGVRFSSEAAQHTQHSVLNLMKVKWRTLPKPLKVSFDTHLPKTIDDLYKIHELFEYLNPFMGKKVRFLLEEIHPEEKQ